MTTDFSAEPVQPSRRRWLKWGIGGALLLGVGGAAVLSLKPAWQAGRLSAGAGAVFRAVGAAVLGEALPIEAAAREQALTGLVERIEALVAALPAYAQTELAQLLGLLDTAAGRRGLAGLSEPWASASASQVQSALQGMRTSGLAMKQQAYHALHDVAAGAYFSAPSTWGFMGYPGPTQVG